jgi:ATP-binding cassette subfamily B protein
MRGAVEFRNVCFQYDGAEPALDEITFSVEPGQTVAIVGQTGSGKTTLAKLVNRTYDATGGHVLVDGVDVRDWNMTCAKISRSSGRTSSCSPLHCRTSPLAISASDKGSDAARAAQAEDFIGVLEEGYQTVIGERGVTLSGGQRQRIALARAFLTDPPILILDDSTSAIDSATEDRIQRAILTAARGRTTFIITHRLSQIRWADLILVMRKGKLVARGTHEELMKTSEGYRRIFSE